MESNRLHLLAAGLTIFSLTLFPLADAISKTLTGAVPVLVIVWVRFFGSALLVTPLILIRRPFERPSLRAILTEAVRACIVIVAFGAYVYSFQTIRFAEAATYYSFAPIVSAALAIVFLKERLSVLGICALFLGLIGVVVALNPQVSPEPGAYFAIGTGLLYGCYLFLNRVVAVRWNLTMAMFLQFWIGSLILTPLIWPYLTPALLQHLPAFAGIAVISVVCNFMLINAYRMAPANFLAPFLYIEIPSALLMAVVLFDEQLSWNILWGAALILVAGVTVLREKPQISPAHPERKEV